MIGSTMARRRLGRIALAAVTILEFGMAGGGSTALAGTEPGITLHIGQSVTKNYSIPGVAADELAKEDVNNEAGTGAPPPSDCASSPSMGCVVVPITLQVPASYFKTRDLAMNITLSWSGDVGANTAIGVEETQEERAYLWQTPTPKDVNGNPVFDQYDDSANPGFISQVKFTSKSYSLEIIQTRSQGIPLPVKVVYTFQDLTGQSFPGEKSYASSVPQAPPPASVTTAANPSTGTALGIGGTVPAGAAPPVQRPQVATVVVPDIKGGAISPALMTAAQVSLPNGLGVSGATSVNGVNTTVTTKAPPASTGSEVIGLGVLPVLAVLFALLMLARRRRQRLA